MPVDSWENTISEVIKSSGFEVVELRKEQRKKVDIIKIFIDTDSGITIDNCTKVSRLVNDAIFKYDLFERDYRLEVSSPGVDRPLITYKDFRRNISRRVRITLEGNDKHGVLEGKLIAADENELVIEGRQGKHTIPIKNVVEGKIILLW